MSLLDPSSLPLAQRLALTYAPRGVRGAVLSLLALDNRLAAILRQGGEPVIAQIKLAWWRDRLGEDPAAWPTGEPLLETLRDWPGGAQGLVPLVDGWEALLAEDLTMAAIEQFAQGRALAWQSLAPPACEAVAAAAAREWALADLARNLGTEEEAAAARRLVQASKPVRQRLPRNLRPLGVMLVLTRRALDRDSGELLDGAGALFAALRVGLTGR